MTVLRNLQLKMNPGNWGFFHIRTFLPFPALFLLVFFSTDIRGLTSASQLEQLNKRYWYICQDFTEYKYTHQPNRFPDLMMCLPEIRYIAGNISKVILKILCLHRNFCCAVFLTTSLPLGEILDSPGVLRGYSWLCWGVTPSGARGTRQHQIWPEASWYPSCLSGPLCTPCMYMVRFLAVACRQTKLIFWTILTRLFSFGEGELFF